MLLPLSESFDLLFSICYLTLVIECCLDLFYKFIPILGIVIIFYLVNFLLGINTSCVPSKLGQHCSDLLLLRNNCILLYWFSNFIWFLSNYSGFRTIFFCVTIFDVVSVSAASVFALNILLHAISVILVPSKASSSMILNDSNISSSTSISVAFCLVLSILFIQCLNYNTVL